MAQKIIIELVVNGVEEISSVSKSLKEVGVEAKNAEKSTDRYSGAIKKSNPIIEELNKRTGGLVNAVLDFGDATKKANISLKGTRTALIATGIGAFVVALGLVVAYWDEIVDLIEQADAQLEQNLTNNQAIASNLQAQLATKNKQIELAKLEGKATEQLEKQKIAILGRLRENNETQVKILETQLKRLEATSLEVSYWDEIRIAATKAFLGAGEAAKLRAKLQGKRLKEIQDLKTQLEQTRLAALDLEVTLFNTLNPSSDGKANGRDKVEGVNSIERKKIENKQLLEIEGAFSDAKIALEYHTQASITAAQEEAARKRAEITRLENEQKLMLTSDTLGKVASLFGETTKAGKLAGSAQALINTYLGVTSVLSNPTILPEPFGTINKIASAAVVLASGLKAVKQINSVKTPSGGGGGSIGGGLGGSLSAPATPSFNVVGNTGINQIGQAIGEKNNEPTRAYVVFDDVKKAENIDNESVREAQL